jgi:hypothetical protein
MKLKEKESKEVMEVMQRPWRRQIQLLLPWK